MAAGDGDVASGSHRGRDRHRSGLGHHITVAQACPAVLVRGPGNTTQFTGFRLDEYVWRVRELARLGARQDHEWYESWAPYRRWSTARGYRLVAHQKAAGSTPAAGTRPHPETGGVFLSGGQARGVLSSQSGARLGCRVPFALSALVSPDRWGLRYVHLAAPDGPQGWDASGYAVRVVDLRSD
jgi:hypothetical protein